MNQTSKTDQQKRQQSQSGDKDTGMQQGANLGQKNAGRDRHGDDELKRMGETGKKD
jgi:hypothetical protein